MSSRASLTSWGKGASLVLVGDPSSDGVIIKMPYGVDVFTPQMIHTPLFSIGLVETESAFIVRLLDQLRLA